MDLSASSTLVTTLVFFVALIVSVGFHEFAHVLSAYLQGDQTGKLLGRLTLNPIRHLDPLGTLFMLVAAVTHFGIGWGKPAPFNPYNLRFKRWGSALVAIAGPVSNIVLMTIAGYALILFGSQLPVGNLLLVFLSQVVLVNASLAIFNLLPIMPLDGSHILTALLGYEHPLVIVLQRYGMYLLLFLLIFGGGLLAWYLMHGVTLLLHAVGLGQLLV